MPAATPQVVEENKIAQVDHNASVPAPLLAPPPPPLLPKPPPHGGPHPTPPHGGPQPTPPHGGPHPTPPLQDYPRKTRTI